MESLSLGQTSPHVIFFRQDNFWIASGDDDDDDDDQDQDDDDDVWEEGWRQLLLISKDQRTLGLTSNPLWAHLLL